MTNFGLRSISGADKLLKMLKNFRNAGFEVEHKDQKTEKSLELTV